MLNQFSQTVEICDRLGLPLVAMINPVEIYQFDAERLAYVCRVGAELGADLVKTDYPGSELLFKPVVDNCPVPVLVEETPHPETEEGTLKTTREVIAAGGAGVMFGSRVWGQADPAKISRKISEIIHP
jgi:fructose-bisphosphate aldolase/2-amino-3,7-dideoxy-D-threo-hept-6-ulosonate synthase